MAKKIKVLQLIESGGPGGAETVVLRLSRALLERNIETSVVTFREGWLTESLKEQGIKHDLVPSLSKFDFGLPIRLGSIITKHSANIVHSHLLDSNFYGALSAKITRTRHLATEHGDLNHPSKKKYLACKVRLLRLLRSNWAAVSKFSAEQLANYGVPESRISVVPNPIPEQREAAGERALTRDELGLEEEAEKHWLWIHVANFRAVKDQSTLIRGFAKAVELSDVPQTLCLVGDGDLRGELEELSVQLGVSGSVRFLGFRNDVQKYLRAADGFVLSSRSEAMPVSLLEAAACGLVVVSSNVGGVPELIVPGKTGHLFEVGNAEQLGKRLSKVVSEQTESKTIASALRRQVTQTMSMDAVADAYVTLYEKLL